MSSVDTQILLRFDPLDTLFFRDGSPWDKNESDQSNVVSQFPPPPSTLVGAVRAACARAMGWSSRGEWSAEIKLMLGDGDDLARLRFRGPLVLHGDELVFPAPANLMLTADKTGTALLRPGPPSRCDLGEAVRLPVMPVTHAGDGWKTAGSNWLTTAGMRQWLQGNAPETSSLIESTKLWKHEARVGIQRNAQTRTTQEGAIYSPQHIRLNATVSLGLWASGLPNLQPEITEKPQPLGGESRSVWMSVPEHAPEWPSAPSDFAVDAQYLHYTVAILSPLPMQQAPMPGDTYVAGLPGHLVSACLPRPQILGGWDSVNHRPLALAPHLAPGSVLFMRANLRDATAVRALHGTCIGSRAPWGFGLVVTGTWRDYA